uniref:AAA domain-containing protein n=1 Tax=Nocardia asiatica TaxID=209252 RepID=UPI003CC80CCA
MASGHAAFPGRGRNPPPRPSGTWPGRDAVRNALRFPISVIDGPPGTGKTQTILNIIASVICRPDATVGVVS